jgi:hypothetical protein
MNDKAIEILDRLNEAADMSEYGRYISKPEFGKIVREVMFGKPEQTKVTYYKHSYGGNYSYHHKVYKHTKMVDVPKTKEQTQKLNKIFERMLDKGIIKLSKSGNMVKPMMTSSEWVAMNQKGE